MVVGSLLAIVATRSRGTDGDESVRYPLGPPVKTTPDDTSEPPQPDPDPDPHAHPHSGASSGSTELPRDASVERIRAGHAAVRRANRSEVSEDYVEAIDGLIAEKGVARVSVLARQFGVSDVAATLAVERLRKAGYVSSAKHEALELTDEGRELAARSRSRHAAVLRFFLAFGIPTAVAASDAEGVEHHVGDETLAAFAAFVERNADALAAAEAKAAAEDLVHPTDPTRFERVRAAHAAELTEDYVEAIDDLVRQSGEARVGALAELFGVTHVTASRMVSRLRKLDLVRSEHRRPVELTEEGKALAARSRKRHAIVLQLLLDLGVPQEAAEIDAEGVEHHVSEETLTLFDAFSRDRATDSK